MNLEKIQSKDQRPLISCFVIIVSHSRPSRHTLPRGTVRRCFSIGRKPLPRTTRLYGCTGLLHCYTLPKRPRCTVASFMLPKRDASSSPKRPAGERKKGKRRRKPKTAFVPAAEPPVDLDRPDYPTVKQVELRDEKAMPKLKKTPRGRKPYVKPSLSPEVVETFHAKCTARTCMLDCCRHLSSKTSSPSCTTPAPGKRVSSETRMRSTSTATSSRVRLTATHTSCTSRRTGVDFSSISSATLILGTQCFSV